MKKKQMRLILFALFSSFVLFFVFDYVLYSPSTKTYDSGISEYGHDGHEQNVKSEEITHRVRKKESAFQKQEASLSLQLKQLIGKKVPNKKALDSLLQSQQKLQEEYCRGMAAMGITELSNCK